MRAVANVLLAAVLCAACQGDRESETTRFEGDAFGTYYVVQVAETVTESDRIGIERAIGEALDEVDRKMSTYEPTSELSRFNGARVDVAVPVSFDTWRVVSEALEVSELTGGAFDVTVGPLVELWGFGVSEAAERVIPDDEVLLDVLGRVGYGKLELDDDPPSMTKHVRGLECDLSGIAKGYAVDQVAESLTKRGVENFMVEVGGEVRTAGKNASGEAWRIGIESPVPGADGLYRTVSLSGLSIATSGDYRDFFEVDGERFSHLIDPRSGRPVSHNLASVSVIDDSCMRADALASGLLVLGPQEGYELAAELDLVALFLIRAADGTVEELTTPSFRELFF